jgi:dihydropteroate synthase
VKLATRTATLDFPLPPVIMGIVNLVADSFSGDGVTEIGAALDRARQQLADGARIIDIGAESARTNRGPIPEEEEAAQLLRFIARWPELVAERPSDWPPPLLSINTWRPGVVRAVLPHGGDLLNDIGGLPTDENARICADTGAALLLMHTVGQPKVAHTHLGYDDVMVRIEQFFAEKIPVAENAGLHRDAIVLDPGIDFAKQRADNLRIYRELDRLHSFARPVLLPISRKTVIGEVLGLPNAAERDAGTIACLVQGILHGAQIFRVHNVRAAAQAAHIVTAVESSGALPR